MKITALETIRMAERPNLIWVQVETDAGLTGLGETFFGAAAVEAHLHEHVAPRVIGRDPLEIDRLAGDVAGYLGFRSTGAEMRGNSAFDIALWDIFGKATGQPIAQLLGGFTRREIRTYNTCAGVEYIKTAAGQSVANFGLGASARYDDLNAFLHRADELAHSSPGGGHHWHEDLAVRHRRRNKTGGISISSGDLRAALEPFEKIRRAVGDAMDIMVELHSNCGSCCRRCRSPARSTPYGTYWHEDPIKMDSLADLRRYAAASVAPIAASETLGGKAAFRDLLETGAAGVVIARPVLVRRAVGSAQDRRDGRSLAPADRSARLHRAGGAGGLHASVAERAERAGAGERPRLSPHLVRRCRHRAAADQERHDLRSARPGPGAGAQSRSRSGFHYRPQTVGCGGPLKHKTTGHVSGGDTMKFARLALLGVLLSGSAAFADPLNIAFTVHSGAVEHVLAGGAEGLRGRLRQDRRDMPDGLRADRRLGARAGGEHGGGDRPQAGRPGHLDR